MRIKLTELKSIIAEIVREAGYSFERKFKYPTPEDQARIQREFHMPIDFSRTIKTSDASDFEKLWSHVLSATPNHGFFYSVVDSIIGLTIKPVLSTMDDDFAVVLAAVVDVNSENSSAFDRPNKYMCMAYGPKELMRQVELTINAEIFQKRGNGKGEGTRLAWEYITNNDLYLHIGQLISNSLVEYIGKNKLDVKIGPSRGTFLRFEFSDEDIAMEACKGIIPVLEKRMKHDYSTIGFKITVEPSSYNIKFKIRLFNIYTSHQLAVFTANNVEVEID